MKSGANYVVLRRLDIDTSQVDKIIFAFKSMSALITKEYPGNDVTEKDKLFSIKLYQEDTIALKGDVSIEAQINFKDGAVGKTAIDSIHISNSLFTEVVEGNNPTGTVADDVTFEVVGDVIIGKIVGEVEPEVIEKAVEDYLDKHPIPTYDDTQIKLDIKDLQDNKQNNISDLEEIRLGANKGATALQSVPSDYAKKTDIPSLTEYAKKGDSYTKNESDNKYALKGEGGGSSDVWLTQAEYDALPSSKLTDNKHYIITDANNSELKAENIPFSSKQGLKSTDVGNALDEVSSSLSQLKNVSYYDDIKNPINYRVGIFSDAHVGYFSGDTDMKRCLNLFSEVGVDITCFCGDIESRMEFNQIEFEIFKRELDASNFVGGDNFFACRGNHDIFASDEYFKTITSCEPNYYFEKNGDVYLFLSPRELTSGETTVADYSNALTYLNSIKSEIDGKRMFVFIHYPFYNHAGVQTDTVYGFGRTNPEGNALYDYFKTQRALVFGGHSHLSAYDEQYQENINVDKDGTDTFATVHIPSTAYARAYDYATSGNTDSAISESIVMDVCDDYVVIHYVDLVTKNVIKSYVLDETFGSIRKGLFNGIFAYKNNADFTDVIPSAKATYMNDFSNKEEVIDSVINIQAKALEMDMPQGKEVYFKFAENNTTLKEVGSAHSYSINGDEIEITIGGSNNGVYIQSIDKSNIPLGTNIMFIADEFTVSPDVLTDSKFYVQLACFNGGNTQGTSWTTKSLINGHKINIPTSEVFDRIYFIVRTSSSYSNSLPINVHIKNLRLEAYE